MRAFAPFQPLYTPPFSCHERRLTVQFETPFGGQTFRSPPGYTFKECFRASIAQRFYFVAERLQRIEVQTATPVAAVDCRV